MIDVLAPLALVGLALLVVVFVRAARKQRGERARPFRELADRRGWRYLETDDGTAEALSEGFRAFAHFSFPSLGERPATSVVLGEVEEGRACLFLHATRKHEGDARLWTICLLEAASRLGPPLEVRSREVRRAREVGVPPAVELDDPAFDRRFEARSPEPDEAGAALGPGVRDVLVEGAAGLPFPVDVQVRDDRVAAYPAGRNDGAASAAELEELLGFTRRVAAGLGA